MINLVVGFIAAFLLAALPGKAVIARLQQMKVTQNVSSDAPTSHSKKQGTPTMGGVLILFSLTVVVLGYFVLTQAGAHVHPAQDYALLPLLLMTLAFGAIGFADDYLGMKRGKNLGFRAREKLAAQCLVAVAFMLWLAVSAQLGTTTVQILPPQVTSAFARDPFPIDFHWLYYPLAVVFIIGLSNATNFTDGLDGLSSGVTILISLTLATLVWAVKPDLGFYCVALAGALAGFLWWNAPPARVFMGDTASLALGATLAGVAIMGKQEVGLIIASLVCWAELVSVMIQVSVFKLRKRQHGIEYARAYRVFRRTPLHHHFEELGWAETQVVIRFWLAGMVCAGLALLWGRG
jgi:phospho-N-acetylmuramoyl-pentapeptide-transferase